MAKKKIVARQKKKRWFQILSSDEFRRTPIGETLSLDGKGLVGKTVRVNLMNLTNNPRNQNINMGFRISEVKGEELHTNLIRYAMLPAHVKRMVRPSKSKLDDSFSCVTKDNVTVRVKPLFLTRNVVKSSILTSLRSKSRELVIKFVKENDYSSVVLNLIEGRLQKEFKMNLSKIYPLTLYQIKVFERIK